MGLSLGSATLTLLLLLADFFAYLLLSLTDPLLILLLLAGALLSGFASLLLLLLCLLLSCASGFFLATCHLSLLLGPLLGSALSVCLLFAGRSLGGLTACHFPLLRLLSLLPGTLSLSLLRLFLSRTDLFLLLLDLPLNLHLCLLLLGAIGFLLLAEPVLKIGLGLRLLGSLLCRFLGALLLSLRGTLLHRGYRSVAASVIRFRLAPRTPGLFEFCTDFLVPLRYFFTSFLLFAADLRQSLLSSQARFIWSPLL